MWKVTTNKKVAKKLQRYSFINTHFERLISDLKQYGPQLTWWSHFSKLKNGSGLYHCHISSGKKGFPTLIALWIVVNEKDKIMEVRDVITHGEFDKKY